MRTLAKFVIVNLYGTLEITQRLTTIKVVFIWGKTTKFPLKIESFVAFLTWPIPIPISSASWWSYKPKASQSWWPRVTERSRSGLKLPEENLSPETCHDLKLSPEALWKRAILRICHSWTSLRVHTVQISYLQSVCWKWLTIII